MNVDGWMDEEGGGGGGRKDVDIGRMRERIRKAKDGKQNKKYCN